jgi:hypothetical protein
LIVSPNHTSFCYKELNLLLETNRYGSELIKHKKSSSASKRILRTKSIAAIPAQPVYSRMILGNVTKGAALVLSNHTFTGNCSETEQLRDIKEQAIIKKEKKIIF